MLFKVGALLTVADENKDCIGELRANSSRRSDDVLVPGPARFNPLRPQDFCLPSPNLRALQRQEQAFVIELNLCIRFFRQTLRHLNPSGGFPALQLTFVQERHSGQRHDQQSRHLMPLKGEHRRNARLIMVLQEMNAFREILRRTSEKEFLQLSIIPSHEHVCNPLVVRKIESVLL